MNAKGYSEKDEKSILDVLGRGLLKEFPNPDRTGCPGSNVLKRIAFHEMPLVEAEKWLDHLTSCSPCYSDFSQFRSAYQKRRSRTLFAIAVASWVLFLRQRQPMATEAAVLDLRNRSVPRGTESNPAEPPLEIGRNVSRMEVYLPIGSADGVYELSIRSQEGRPVFTGSGMAKVKEGITSLSLDVNLSSASSGLYVLQLRKVGSVWNSYPMRLR